MKAHLAGLGDHLGGILPRVSRWDEPVNISKTPVLLYPLLRCHAKLTAVYGLCKTRGLSALPVWAFCVRWHEQKLLRR